MMTSHTIEAKIGLMTEGSLFFDFLLFGLNKALVAVTGTRFAIQFDLSKI